MKKAISIDPKPHDGILRILLCSQSSRPVVVFGITGDIDNLGEFVATNGRARGENLVDHYTMLLDRFLQNWKQAHADNVIDMCFIPAGEEVSVFGLAVNSKVPTSLFRALRKDFPQLLKHHHRYLGSHITSVTFGCEIFSQPNVLRRVKRFVRMKSVHSYAEYLALMELLRKRLALQVDQEKFKSLLKGDKRKATALRKYVYHKVLMHKHETAKELPLIMDLLKTPKRIELDEGIKPKANIRYRQIQKKVRQRWKQ